MPYSSSLFRALFLTPLTIPHYSEHYAVLFFTIPSTLLDPAHYFFTIPSTMPYSSSLFRALFLTPPTILKKSNKYECVTQLGEEKQRERNASCKRYNMRYCKISIVLVKYCNLVMLCGLSERSMHIGVLEHISR